MLNMKITRLPQQEMSGQWYKRKGSNNNIGKYKSLQHVIQFFGKSKQFPFLPSNTVYLEMKLNDNRQVSKPSLDGQNRNHYPVEKLWHCEWSLFGMLRWF